MIPAVARSGLRPGTSEIAASEGFSPREKQLGTFSWHQNPAGTGLEDRQRPAAVLERYDMLLV